MEPTAILIGLLTLAALTVPFLVVLHRRRRRRTAGCEVVFELRLPSKWAAELTAQILENDDIRSSISRAGSHWICRVRRPMGSDRSQVETLCRRLNQVAAARGGGCAAHRISLGSRVRIFEH